MCPFSPFLEILLHYVKELWLWLLIGFLISGIIHEFAPKAIIDKHLGGKGIAPILKATFIGAFLPICCVGSLPVAVTLHKRGVPLGNVLAFLVATPATSISALLVTYALLGIKFTIFIFFAAMLLGIIIGLIGNNIKEKNKIDKSKIPPCPYCGSTEHTGEQHTEDNALNAESCCESHTKVETESESCCCSSKSTQATSSHSCCENNEERTEESCCCPEKEQPESESCCTSKKTQAKSTYSCCENKEEKTDTSCCSGQESHDHDNDHHDHDEHSCCSVETTDEPCKFCGKKEKPCLCDKVVKALKFAFVDLLWEQLPQIAIGLAIAALIASFAPIASFVSNNLGGALGYAFSLVFGLVMYICSTASVPMVHAFIEQGMLPGAGMVLLLAGPVTSLATILILRKEFGMKILLLYLSLISVLSIAAGLVFSLI